MAKYVIEDTTLNNTANAIREKTGKTDKITPSNFATEISSIESGSKVTKGIVINECDENGYATDVSIVGMTNIPNYYIGTDYTNKRSALCQNLKKIELPEEISTIGNYAFANCENLTMTKLPNGITVIYASAFSSCSNLALTELPSGLTRILGTSFNNCKNLALMELPSGLTEIGEKAFYNCEKMTISEIPSGITKIGAGTFYGCLNLSKIICQGAITEIAGTSWQGAFAACSNLVTFALPNVIAVPTLGHATYIFNSTPIGNGTGYIYVPDVLVDSFKSATNWSTYADQIKPISELEVSS